MQTNLYLDLVEDFHRAFQYRQPTPKLPSLDDETCELRVELIHEEYEEILTAYDKGDEHIELLDGFCDLQYVTSGAVLAFGLRQSFAELLPFVMDNENECGLLRAVNMFTSGVERRIVPIITLALCRIQYSIHANIAMAGFADVFDRAFQKVHESNMSKLWTACEMESWVMANEKDHEMRFFNAPHGFIATRKDGKIIKSPSFVAPELGSLIQSMYADRS